MNRTDLQSCVSVRCTSKLNLLYTNIYPLFFKIFSCIGYYRVLSSQCYTVRSLLLIEGNGNPLQYSCLENPRDRGAWWAAVYGVTQSRTRLKRLSSSSSSSSMFSSFLVVKCDFQIKVTFSSLKTFFYLVQ